MTAFMPEAHTLLMVVVGVVMGRPGNTNNTLALGLGEPPASDGVKLSTCKHCSKNMAQVDNFDQLNTYLCLFHTNAR